MNSLTSKIFSKILLAVTSSAFISILLIFITALVSGKIEKEFLISFFARHSFVGFFLVMLIIAVSLIVARSVTKSVVKSFDKMSSDLNNIEENCTYDELKPFAEKINAQLDNQRRLEKLTTQFTANLSHELKTPLTAISGYGELLQSTNVTPENASRFGGIIYKESQRLINLTHDIIQLSQLEEYDFKPIIDSVDLMEVVSACVDALSVEAQKKNITIIKEGSSSFVKGSKSLLEELVYNLVENAIRYNVENGKIFISVNKNENGYELVVKDTGIGIPDKYQSRIFERFFRVDKSRSKETGGTGLGLAIVKHSAEYLGGTVKLESTENVGTTVTVSLPKR